MCRVLAWPISKGLDWHAGRAVPDPWEVPTQALMGRAKPGPRAANPQPNPAPSNRPCQTWSISCRAGPGHGRPEPLPMYNHRLTTQATNPITPSTKLLR